MKIGIKQTEKLMSSGRWLVRTSDKGTSYNGFQWKPVGKWTTAPDWSPEPVCGGGLHGQNEQYHGYFQISGMRLELCPTDDIPIGIDGDKCKCHSAIIVAIDENIPIEFLTAIGLKFAGKPSLKTLTSVGGNLSINCDADLPALTSVGGYLSINCDADLPALTSVGGNLSINCDADLPALTSVGGNLYIYSRADLPALTSVGGHRGKYVNNKWMEGGINEANEGIATIL